MAEEMIRCCKDVPWPLEENTTSLVGVTPRAGWTIWDFHACEGHVITGEIECSAKSGHYCGMCGHISKPHMMWMCECGSIWPGDWHHYRLIESERGGHIV